MGDIGPPVDVMQTGYVPYEPKKRELTQKVAQKMPGSFQQPADGTAAQRDYNIQN